MRTLTAIILIALGPILSSAQTPQQDYNALKAALDHLNSKLQCGDNPKIILEHSLDDYIYNTFGKVALDNSDYVANSTAFNATFSSDDAALSASYMRPLKNPGVVWSIGGKAEAEDGSFLFLNKNELNFGFGAQTGFTFLGHGNGVYYDKLHKNLLTCEEISELRQDTIRSLCVHYYDLVQTNVDSLKQRIETINKILNTADLDDYDNVGKNPNSVMLLTERKNLQDKLDAWSALQEQKNAYEEACKKAKHPSKITPWQMAKAEEDLGAFDKGIIEKYTTGYHLSWYDVRISGAGENKNYLDLNDADNDFTPQKPFGRFTALGAANYYHLGKRTLYYIRGELTLGNGWGYDVLTPSTFTFDTVMYNANGKALNAPGDEVKAFNKYTDPDFRKQYFAIGFTPTVNIFFGAKKVFGLEAMAGFKLLASGKDVKAPFEFHGGILFSPIDKDKKTNEGAIGLLLGMKKMDLSNTAAIGKKNIYIAVRVGIPLSAPMTRK